jgi:hypothetical protein
VHAAQEVDGAQLINCCKASSFLPFFLYKRNNHHQHKSKPSYLLPHTVFPFFIILPSSPSPCHHMICFPFFSEYFRCFFYPSFFLTSLTSFGGLVFNRLHLFHNEFLMFPVVLFLHNYLNREKLSEKLLQGEKM